MEDFNKSKYDVRYHPDMDDIFKSINGLNYRPLVGLYDLKEIVKVDRALPELTYPINSAGELIEKLGGSGKFINLENIEMDPLRMIKYMPAYYFPIPDKVNFYEKMGELIRLNRHQVDLPKEMNNIKSETKEILSFPIKNRGELLKQLKNSKEEFTYQGKKVDLESMIQRLPDNYFPFSSESDFYSKIQDILVNRPLIEPHR